MVAGFEELVDGLLAEFVELRFDPVLEQLGGLCGVSVGSAEGFVDDRVDDLVFEVVLGGQVERDRGGGVGLLVRLLPEDRGAALWGDDGVPRVFEHRDAVSDGDSQRTARAAFTDDDGHDGDFQAGHLAKVDRDRFGLSAFFSTESGVGAGGVDEGDDRQTELLRFAHLGECFAVALWVGASEVAREFFLGGFAFLVSDDEALAVADASESGDERGVVCEGAVAVEFAEVSADVVDVVAGLRTVWMARHADGVPRGEVCVDILEHLDASFFEEFEVFWVGIEVFGIDPAVDASECGDFDAWGFDGFAGEFDLFFDRDDGFLELKLVESGHIGFLLWLVQLYRIDGAGYAMGMQSIQIPLLFVGGGNMAHAIFSGAHASGVLEPSRVGVLDRNADRRGLYETAFESAGDAMDWLVDVGGDGCGIVLAVKPQTLGVAAEALKPRIEEAGLKPTVISILAGTRSDGIFDAMGSGCRVVRVMPNTPAQVGLGMSAIAGSGSSTDPDVELAERLMSAVGDVVRIDEAMMDAFTAVAGSGPAYLFYLVEAMTKAAVSLGFDDAMARRIVERTVIGSASLLDASDDEAAVLRSRVTSKNGTTYAATTTLDERGVMDAFVHALTAARDRGVELGRGG